MIRKAYQSLLIIASFLLIIVSSEIPKVVPDHEIKQWFEILESQGVKVTRYKNKGLGIQALKYFPAESPIFCVDEEQKIMPDDVYSLTPYVHGLQNATALKARMLYEKFMGKSLDHFNLYVHSMSQSYFHPGAWNAFQLEYFKKINFFDYSDEELFELEEWNLIKTRLLKVPGIPEDMLLYDSYMWASFHTKSRYFWCYLENDEYIDCLVPYIDIANHRPIHFLSGLQEFFHFENGKRCIKSHYDFHPGDEVTIDYALRNPKVMFLHYAMAIENHAYDAVNFLYHPKNLTIQLYASEVSAELLSYYTCELGNCLDLSGGIRKKLAELPQEMVKETILPSLLVYRKQFRNYFLFIKPGLREVRRDRKELFDWMTLYINTYGISSRQAYYNHLRRVDSGLLQAIFSLI